MKKILKNLLTTMLCIICIAAFTACGQTGEETSSSSQTQGDVSDSTQASSNAIEVNIKAGESYKFNDVEDSGLVDDTWKCESQDEKVAKVRAGMYIIGTGKGETTVTVSKGTETDVYKVTVSANSDMDRLASAEDDRDISVYLGAGYNAFEMNGYPNVRQIKLRNPIIKKRQVSELLESGDVIRDGSEVNSFETIQGTSTDEYGDSYAKKIGAQLDVSVKGGMIGGGANVKFEDTDSSDSSESHAYTSIISLNQKYVYSFDLDDEELTELAKKNKSAWKALTGTMTPEDVFDKYGTHMIVSAVIGGRTELDYSLTAKSSSKTSKELLDVAGKVNVDLKAVKGDAKGEYSTKNISSLKNSNTSVKTSVTTYGGSTNPKGLMTDLETYCQGYAAWYGSLKDENLTFIGVNAGGLHPIWTLLPNDEKYKERRQELKNYYFKKMGIEQ